VRKQASILQRLSSDGSVAGALRIGWLALLPLVAGPSAAAQTPAEPPPLVEARRLYNQGRYEAAITTSEQVAASGTHRPQALLVLGRARMERYRQTAEVDEFLAARAALRDVDASLLDDRDRVELIVGLGQGLFLDGQYRAAAEVFNSALDGASLLGPSARDQLLDWWATALDRDAQTREVTARASLYDRIVLQMEQELRRDAGAASASYWLPAALRLRGDVDRAWDTAQAGWVRAQLARDRGAALRPDLDQLVRDGIIPDRARRAANGGQDVEQLTSAMSIEWEQFKEKWQQKPLDSQVR
jgi:tetratricopeptide (TPR) repeat protein